LFFSSCKNSANLVTFAILGSSVLILPKTSAAFLAFSPDRTFVLIFRELRAVLTFSAASDSVSESTLIDFLKPPRFLINSSKLVLSSEKSQSCNHLDFANWHN